MTFKEHQVLGPCCSLYTVNCSNPVLACNTYSYLTITQLKEHFHGEVDVDSSPESPTHLVMLPMAYLLLSASVSSSLNREK